MSSSSIQIASTASAQRLPVARPRLPDAQALLPYLERIDAARWYSNFGPLLTEFETRLEARFRRPTGVATTVNGTQAITLALTAMGVRQGGLCAMPAWTFAATAHAAVQAGLVPWFLDVDPVTWMLDPAHVARSLESAPGPVSAVVPVAAFGQVPDLSAWKRFADETGLPVLLDAAAAFDSLTEAPIPCAFSLHATKGVSTGEGGYVASEDAELIARVKQLTVFGFKGDRESHRPATNAKLSEYAAAVGLASMDAWPAQRLRLGFSAGRLRVAFALTPDVVFQRGWGTRWVSTVAMVSLPLGAAEAVARTLDLNGLEGRAWWGMGCHRTNAFRDCPRQALPITNMLATSTIGLPFSSDLDEQDAYRIADATLTALRSA